MRRQLCEGSDVTVHYLGAVETGRIERIEDGGRTMLVVTESDAVLEFHLMASVHYFTRDRAARLALN
jgi:hypothetical protein